jgi:hypothetical protein
MAADASAVKADFIDMTLLSRTALNFIKGATYGTIIGASQAYGAPRRRGERVRGAPPVHPVALAGPNH